MMRWLLAAIIAVVAAGGAYAQVPYPKSTLNSQVSTTFPDQLTGATTPALVRTFENNAIASWQQDPIVNPQTGTTYTVVGDSSGSSDHGKLITFKNAGAIAVTLAAASATGFYPFSFFASDLGAGTATITPQGGSTINGAASFGISTNQSVLVISDGTNWQVFTGVPTTANGCTVSGATVGYLYNTGASSCATSSTLQVSGGKDVESGTLNVSGTFQVGGNTMTFPGTADTLAGLGTVQSFTAAQTWTAAVNFNSTFNIGGNTITWPGAATTVAALNIADQTLTGGANVTPFSIGTPTNGSNTTLDCGKGPLQTVTNNVAAFTLTAPTNDGSCIIQVTNGASAGTITWSGFTEGANTGDPFTTTNTSKFNVSVTRINAISHYIVSAYQ